MSSENKCCYIADIIGKHSQLYNTTILNDIKTINNTKQFIYYNFPIYLEDNLLIKNINQNTKQHIWHKILNTELIELYLIKPKVRVNSEKFLPKKEKFNIIYSAIKKSTKNNTTVEYELQLFYDDINDDYIRNLAYYMALTSSVFF
jgi:hypothetical protein|tara:strand:- start:799 stop:1236 length:438 start_codon:yes stop_codon:yes gene_type:complete